MRLLSVVSILLVVVACERDEESDPNRLGEVLPGPVTVEQGNVTANTLNDKLSQVHPVMEACYSKTLRENPDAKGAVDFTLRAEKPGLVVDVTKNTLPDSSLSQCIIQAVKSMDFSSDSAGMPVFVAKWSVSLNNSQVKK